MANNNTVTLIGNLGDAPKTYTKEKGSYIRLSIATTDSYKDKSLGSWIKRKPIWHTVFVNSEKAQENALKYKKGDRIKITGSLSYRITKAADKGHSQTFTEATVAARWIEAAPLPKKDAA